MPSVYDLMRLVYPDEVGDKENFRSRLNTDTAFRHNVYNKLEASYNGVGTYNQFQRQLGYEPGQPLKSTQGNVAAARSTQGNVAAAKPTQGKQIFPWDWDKYRVEIPVKPIGTAPVEEPSKRYKPSKEEMARFQNTIDNGKQIAYDAEHVDFNKIIERVRKAQGEWRFGDKRSDVFAEATKRALNKSFIDNRANEAIAGIDTDSIIADEIKKQNEERENELRTRMKENPLAYASASSTFAWGKADAEKYAPSKALIIILNESQKKLIDYIGSHQETIVWDARRMGLQPREYVMHVLIPSASEKLNESIAGKFSEAQISKHIPHGTSDYLVMTVLNNSVIGTMLNAVNTSEEERQYQQAGLARYNPNALESFLGEAASFAIDQPIFMLTGGTGELAAAPLTRAMFGGATKGTRSLLIANMSKRAVISRLLPGSVVSGSVNLGSYNTLSSIVTQASVGDVNRSLVGDACISGVMTGGILGVASTATGTLTRGWGVHLDLRGVSAKELTKQIAQGAAARGVRFMTEVGTFGIKTSAEQWLSGGNPTWLDNFGESAGLVASMKFGKALTNTGKSLYSITKDVKGDSKKKPMTVAHAMLNRVIDLTRDGYQGMRLTETEKRILMNNADAQNMMEALQRYSATAGEIAKSPQDDKAQKQAVVDYYGKVMNNKTVPWNAKQKLSIAMTNSAMSYRPETAYFHVEDATQNTAAYGEDNRFGLVEYGKDGEVLGQEGFKTREDLESAQLSNYIRQQNISMRSDLGEGALMKAPAEEEITESYRRYWLSRLQDNNGGRYNPSKPDDDPANLPFTKSIEEGGELYDGYVKAREGLTAMEAALMVTSDEYGLTLEEGAAITQKDPLTLTPEEGLFIGTLSKRIHSYVYPEGQLNEEQSKKDGAALADEVSVGGADDADISHASEEINRRLTEARENFDEEFGAGSVAADRFNEGKTTPEKMQGLLDAGASDSQIAAAAQLLNEQAYERGFSEGVNVNLANEAQISVSERGFAGTINGNPDKENIIMATDNAGNRWIVLAGEILADSKGRILNDDMVIVRSDDGDVENLAKGIKASDLTLGEPISKEQWKADYLSRSTETFAQRMETSLREVREKTTAEEGENASPEADTAQTLTDGNVLPEVEVVGRRRTATETQLPGKEEGATREPIATEARETTEEPIANDEQSAAEPTALPTAAEGQPTPQQPSESMPMKTVTKQVKGANGEKTTKEVSVPDWEAATPERSRSYLYEEQGLERQDADEFIEGKIKRSEKGLKDARKGRPKASDYDDPQEFKDVRDEWQRQVDAAQQTVDYWQRVKQLAVKRSTAAPQKVEASGNVPSPRKEIDKTESTNNPEITTGKEPITSQDEQKAGQYSNMVDAEEAERREEEAARRLGKSLDEKVTDEGTEHWSRATYCVDGDPRKEVVWVSHWSTDKESPLYRQSDQYFEFRGKRIDPDMIFDVVDSAVGTKEKQSGIAKGQKKAATELKRAAEESSTTVKAEQDFSREIPKDAVESVSTIKQLVDKAKTIKNRVVRAIIGGISERQKTDFARKGIAVEDDYVHSMENSAIIHNQNLHGDAKAEAAKGQIAITETDYELVPDILANYNDVNKSPHRDKQGREVIVYTKAYQDGTVYYLEEVRDGRKSLAFKTLYKKKGIGVSDGLVPESSPQTSVTTPDNTNSKSKDTQKPSLDKENEEKNLSEANESIPSVTAGSYKDGVIETPKGNEADRLLNEYRTTEPPTGEGLREIEKGEKLYKQDSKANRQREKENHEKALLAFKNIDLDREIAEREEGLENLRKKKEEFDKEFEGSGLPVKAAEFSWERSKVSKMFAGTEVWSAEAADAFYKAAVEAQVYPLYALKRIRRTLRLRDIRDRLFEALGYDTSVRSTADKKLQKEIINKLNKRRNDADIKPLADEWEKIEKEERAEDAEMRVMRAKNALEEAKEPVTRLESDIKEQQEKVNQLSADVMKAELNGEGNTEEKKARQSEENERLEAMKAVRESIKEQEKEAEEARQGYASEQIETAAEKPTTEVPTTEKAEPTTEVPATEKAEQTTETPTTVKIVKQPKTGKIDDWGEVIAGARKNTMKELAEATGKVTKEDVASLPMGKWFKKRDYRKMVEKGQLTPEDATVLEALTQAIKLSSKEQAYYEKTYGLLRMMKRYAEAETADERARLLTEMTTLSDKEKAEIDMRRSAFATVSSEYGALPAQGDYPPTPVKWMIDLLNGVGYVQRGLGKAKIPTTRTSFQADCYYVYVGSSGTVGGKCKTCEEALDKAVRIVKMTRGDTDVDYLPKDFAALKELAEYKPLDTYELTYADHFRRLHKEKGLTKEQAEARRKALNPRSRVSASITPETKILYKEKIEVIDPVTAQYHDIPDIPPFETVEEAQAYIDENIDALQEKANSVISAIYLPKGAKAAPTVDLRVTFDMHDKSWFVYRTEKGSHEKIPVAEGFKTIQDALDWRKKNEDRIAAVLQAAKEKQRKFVFFTPETPRVGKDWRSGKDVTAEQFGETFGFRGVQFGNWTNQADRQKSINEAYDAFMDLADVLGVDPKALSLAGELGIAFGARGSGKANAHYEPDRVVINLTKTRGAGSLAHEWWHALDNYFARQGGAGKAYVTDGTAEKADMRAAVREAFADVVNAVKDSDYDRRSRRNSAYWSSRVEETARLFAEWVKNEIHKRGGSNSFLAGNIDEGRIEEWRKHNYDIYKAGIKITNEWITERNEGKAEADKTPLKPVQTFEEFKKSNPSLDQFPYPLREEVEKQFSKPLRKLFDTIQERIDEKGRHVLYEIGDEGAVLDSRQAEAIADRLKKTGLAKEVVFVDTEEALGEMLEGEDAERFSDRRGRVAGATLPDGTVVLVRENMTLSTPGHEFAHRLRDAAKRMAAGDDDTLLRAIDKYISDVPETIRDAVRKKYGDITEDTLLDEAFAWGLRENDEAAARRFLDERGLGDDPLKRAEAISWYHTLWNYIKALWLKARAALGKKYSDMDVLKGYETMSHEELGRALEDVLWNGKKMKGGGETVERETALERMMIAEAKGSSKGKPASGNDTAPTFANGASDTKIDITAENTTVLERFNNLSESLSKERLSPRNFLKAIKKAFGDVTETDENADKSKYISNTIEGETHTMRIANHHSNAGTFKERGETKNNEAVVIKMSDKRFKGSRDVGLVEFVYFTDHLTTDVQKGIVKGLRDWVKNGNYSDTRYDDIKRSGAEPRFMLAGENERMDGAQTDIRVKEEALSRRKVEEDARKAALKKLDKPYMDAVRSGDTKTAARLVEEAERLAGYSADTDWRLSHQAPNREGDVSLKDLSKSDLVPNDFFSHPENYAGSGLERRSAYILKQLLDKQAEYDKEGNAENVYATIYRAVPKSDNAKESEMRGGDWVTLLKDYAVEHGKRYLNGDYRIIAQRVPIRDIYWDGNSLAEFGYDDGRNYVYKDTKNNRKLADVVTYDDNGKVIPLSKRFDYRKGDVRFMLAGDVQGTAAAGAPKGQEIGAETVARPTAEQRAAGMALVNKMRSAGVKVHLSTDEMSEALSTAQKNLQEMTVWHGSPHEFDRFDFSKMGTGEGAQAYGWGAYVTEVKSIARHYANMRRPKNTTYFGGKPLKTDKGVAAVLRRLGLDIDKYDDLLPQIGECVLGRSSFSQTQTWLANDASSLEADAAGMSQLIKYFTSTTISRDENGAIRKIGGKECAGLRDITDELNSQTRCGYYLAYSSPVMEFIAGKYTEGEALQQMRDFIKEQKDAANFLRLCSEALLRVKDRFRYVRDSSRNLYSVEIPDDNGKNYLSYDDEVDPDEGKRIVAALNEKLSTSRGYELDVEDSPFGNKYILYYCIRNRFEQRRDQIGEWNNLENTRLYNIIGKILGSDAAASKFLHSIGYVGIKYPANYLSGGNKRGDMNYVIFDEHDLKVNTREQFLQTSKGEVYGFVKDGEVYLDPALLNANTPVHEYTHLWDNACRETNSALWERGKALMKQLPVWREVMDDPAYADIRGNEDLVASEVHARLSGEESARLFDEMLKKGDKSIVEKMKAWIDEFWQWLKEHMGLRGETAETLTVDDFKRMPIRDLLNEVNPNDYMTREGSLFTEDPEFFIGKKARREYEALLDKKRPNLPKEERDMALDFLHSLENTKEENKAVKIAVKWLADGTIRLPEDMDKVREAIATADRAHVDALRYDSPMKLLNDLKDYKPKEKPIDPETVPTLHRAKEQPYEDGGVVIYDVDESRESREAMRRIINTHFGEDCSPWCLLQGDKEGRLTEGSARYWEHYNAYPKQVAFRNGRLLAFSANEEEETAWWDRMDEPHDDVGHIATTTSEHRTDDGGRIVTVTTLSDRPVSEKIYARGGRLLKETTYEVNDWGESRTERVYNDDGTSVEEDYDIENNRRERRPLNKDSYLDGVEEQWYGNGQLESRTNYKDGKQDGVEEKWHEDGQLWSRANWKDGKLGGVWEHWHDNGQLQSRANWKDGKLNGVEEQWYKNGQLRGRRTWKDGKQDGVEEEWYDNGKLKRRGNWKYDLLDGIEEKWYDNGKLMSRTIWKVGKKDGLEERWHYNGQPYSRTYWKDGERVNANSYRTVGGLQKGNGHGEESYGRQAIRASVNRLSERYGKDTVTITDSIDTIEDADTRAYVERQHKAGRRVPGWYDAKTGTVHLFMPDVTSRYDAERTILHETAGHKGMRALLGEDGYKEYMRLLMSDKGLGDLQKAVHDRMTRNGWDMYKAVDEYLAERAEEMAKPEDLGFWQTIRRYLTDILRKIGYTINPNVKDVRYMLWLSENNIRRGDPLSEARRQSVLERIRRETPEQPTTADGRTYIDAQTRKGETSTDEDDDIMFRVVSEEPKGNDTVIAAFRKEKYQADMAKNTTRWEEAHFDYANSMRIIIEDLTGKKVEELRDSDNFYYADNHMSSIIEEAENRFAHQEMARLNEAVKKVLPTFGAESKEALRSLNDYLYTKHALERNRVLEVRDFIRALRRINIKELTTDIRELDKIAKLTDDDLRNFTRDVTSLKDYVDGLKQQGLNVPRELAKASKTMLANYDVTKLGDLLNQVSSNIPRAREMWRLVEQAAAEKKAADPKDPASKRSLSDWAADNITADWRKRRVEARKKLNSKKMVYSLEDYYRDLDRFIRDNVDGNFDAGAMDRSGLSGLQEAQRKEQGIEVGDSGIYDDAAMINAVMDAEASMGANDTAALWNGINECTRFALDYDYNSGMHSKATHDHLVDMFDWYVPLRGYEEPGAGDVYDYFNDEGNIGGAGASIVLTARGRKSKAGAVLPMIGKMASDAVRRGEQNKVKQRFLNFARDYSSPNAGYANLLSISKVWMVKHIVDGKETWVTEYAEIPDGADGNSIAKIVSDFNQRMKTLQAKGEARSILNSQSRGAGATNIGLRITQRQLNEHQVLVKVGDESYIVTVCGDPRVAQAVNGLLRPGSDNGLLYWIGEVNSALSSNFTSYNPTFVATNMSRDFQEASANLITKEGATYMIRFEENYLKDVKPLLLDGSLWKEYRAGTLCKIKGRNGTARKNAKRIQLERYFKEFMENGGKTGYVDAKNIDKYRKELEKEMKTGFRHGVVVTGKYVGSVVEGMNERAENAARFATYMTSRQMGRSVLRSVHDAKDVTVNFNRKGSGAKAIGKAKPFTNHWWAGVTAEVPRVTFLFWNAGMQDLAMKYRNAKKHPGRFVVTNMFGYFMMGFANALINKALASILDDDDYEGEYSPYSNLPEWTRRNNWCIYLGKERGFLKIPMPIFVRGFYGLGDVAAGYAFDKNLRSMDHTVAEDVAAQITQMLPVDFLGEGGDIWAALVPDVLKPIAQNMTNKDWTGKPLERPAYWDEGAPAYTRAYKGENQLLVGLAKGVNDLTNDDMDQQDALLLTEDELKGLYLTEEEKDDLKKGNAPAGVKKGWIDLDPAHISNLIQGYLGGMGTSIVDGAALAERVFKMDWEDLDTRKVPVLKAFIQNPSDRVANYRLRTRFYNTLKEARETKAQLSRAKKGKDDPYTYAWGLNFSRSKDYEIANMFIRVGTAVSKLRKRADAAKSKYEREELEDAQISLMNEAFIKADSIRNSDGSTRNAKILETIQSGY